MSEAQNKWEEQDLNSSMKLAREAYKAALRREIDAKISLYRSKFGISVGAESFMWEIKIRLAVEFKELLDTVEP